MTPEAGAAVGATADTAADTRFEHGLVVGKFYPPHAGHLNLVRHALARCRTDRPGARLQRRVASRRAAGAVAA